VVPRSWQDGGPIKLASDTPTLGSVDIELEVLGDLSWSASNSLTGGVSGGNALVGRVEDTDADGVVTLRVGDGILLVDVPDDGPLPRIGEELRLEDLALAFFPTGI
jgi:hypothetical protein